MAQYDQIAEQYQETRQLEIFRIISHTMSHWLGDVTGLSVLDLACGEGGGTRAIKQAGAARVVGVDVSEDMLRLAREAEAKHPLGIEYLACAAQDLEPIGEFDIVTATFLLHYSQNRDELRSMARAAYRNLRPGCRFVTLNENNGKAANWSEEVTGRYGFRWRAPVWPLSDGDPMVISLLYGASQVTFTIRYFCRETYEAALGEAGFQAVHWHELVLPPDMETGDAGAFWAPCMARQPFVVIECLR